MDSETEIFTPAIHRSARRGPFGEEERERLRYLAGHISRAMRLHDLLQVGAVARDGVVSAFDCLDEAIVVFDGTGLVIHLNATAESLLAERDGLEFRQGFLSATHKSSQPALNRLLAETLRYAARESYLLPSPVAIRRHKCRSPLIIRSYVVPNGRDHGRYGVVRIADPRRHGEPSGEMIQAATGLTRAEASLALALFKGLTVAEFAEESGLTEHTVRTRLKHIREKLGARRQADIVALVAQIAYA